MKPLNFLVWDLELNWIELKVWVLHHSVVFGRTILPSLNFNNLGVVVLVETHWATRLLKIQLMNPVADQVKKIWIWGRKKSIAIIFQIWRERLWSKKSSLDKLTCLCIYSSFSRTVFKFIYLWSDQMFDFYEGFFKCTID